MNLAQALRVAVDKLAAAGVPSPEVDARLIAGHLLGTGHMQLDGQRPVPAGFDELVDRRATREPLQHVLGTAPFGHLDLAVGPGVFIPRPETEVLADWGVRQLRSRSSVVVDLCAGSGALGLYVATSLPAATVHLVEKQASALDWLERNADGIPNAVIHEGDVADPQLLPELHGTADLVLTNPPYVPETPELTPEVYADPPEAVFAGPDGMALIPAMIPLIANLLIDGGQLGLEHDETTAAAVRAELHRHGGFADITTMKDLTGRERFATARRVA